MENYLQLRQAYLKRMQGSSFAAVPAAATEPFDDSILKSGATLTQADLLNPQYSNIIRDYMIERKGVDYRDMEDSKLIDDFVEQMRYFNANTVSTAGEVRFISRADARQKEIASRAYQIYDRLGNVFRNDGFAGAVEGVGDYIKAAATDPTNYLGLLTGGVARATAAGGALAGREAIRQALRQAGTNAVRTGAGRQAARQAAETAGIEAARRLVNQGYSTRAAGLASRRVAEAVERQGVAALGRQARTQALREAGDSAARKSLYATTALDSTFAMLQDVQIQGVMLDVAAQEKYSAMQTGFSALAGGIGGLAQLGFGKFRGASGLQDTGDVLERISNAAIEKNIKVKAYTDKATKNIVEKVKTWSEKVQAGKQYDAVPAELIREIILGDATKVNGKTVYKNGILEAFAESGIKYSRDDKISDVMTDFVSQLDGDQLKEINDVLYKSVGIHLGDLSETRIKLGDLLAKQISEFGTGLNTMSVFRKQVNAQLMAANDMIDAKVGAIGAREAIEEALDKPDKLKYTQSVWKRLLVSSPATTMVNVAGFASFYAGQTMADLFNVTTLVAGAALKAPFNKQATAKALRQAHALTTLQAQKIRNLLDPYTTHDAYMDFLKVNPDVQKILFETGSTGVERVSRRFGVDPNSKWFNRVEAVANGANTITGVRIQDSFTKSQMFMAELDKQLRINKGMTLREAMQNGTIDAVDEDILNAATDSTLRSVFAKDYTTTDQPELFRSVASLVETASATPGIGTILPFGRFFNNVLATAYQWTPLSAPGLMIKFANRTIRGGEKSLTETDAVARMLVGTSTLLLAAQYDKERRAKGLGTFEVEAAGGTIVDVKNVYPLSMFLAVGRGLSMLFEGENIPRELIDDITINLGVGQLAKDAQFGNDLYNMFDLMFNADEGTGRNAAYLKSIAKTLGNFAAGFTRPLDAVNRIAGFAMDTDNAKDIRQAETGMQTFSLSATKYIDNIIEAFIDKTDSITGEELRVGTREGAVYDPNPFARIFGVTVKPGRTATEKAYSMAQMQPWTANERSNVPVYDKIFNTMLAPVLEYETSRLLRSKTFQEASLDIKRKLLKERLTEVRGQVRTRFEQGYQGSEGMRLRLVRKVSTGSREERSIAARIMREDYGVEANVRDMNYSELMLMDGILKLVRDMYSDIPY